jgi:hypothetical protein
MRYFLWKIAGGDIQILQKSDELSQYAFRLIGILFLINLSYIFVSTTALFTGIFKGLFVGLLVSLILSFLIASIYLLNILDLEPRTLPRNEIDKKSIYLTYMLRYFSLFLLSLFIVKSMEIFLFQHLFILNFSPQQIIVEIKNLNTKHPEIWIFTFLSLILFFSPIIIKHKLSIKIKEKEKNYYQLKKEEDVRIVVKDYKKFKIQREKILNIVYLDYVKLNELFNEVAKKNSSLKSLSHQYRIRKPKALKEIYVDPPFNTIKISDLNNQISSSHEEYLNTLTENGKLAEGN